MKTNKQNGIITLVVIFGVGLFALASVLTISSGAITEIVKNRDIVLGNNSFHAAEASAKEGAYQYINQITAYTGGSLADINNAQSGVEVIVLDWPLVEIKGSGDNNYSERNVYELITTYPEGLAFDYAIYANNDLNINSGSVVVDGNIFANGDINNHKNAKIKGDAAAGGNIANDENISGNTEENIATIPAPEILPDKYKDTALTNPNFDDSKYFIDAVVAQTYLKNKSRTGAIFIDDPVNTVTKISGATTVLHGSIYTTGDLELVGGTYIADGNYNDFAVFVVEGDLFLAGGVVVKGVVYVKGSTSVGAGGAKITGALISVGGISSVALTGNTEITFDPDIVGNWKDLGINTTSTEEPRVIYWRED